MKAVLVIAAFLVSQSVFAHEKPVDDPACQSIAKSCEAAGYHPGDHKKNGKGLWMDCVHVIAQGKTVSGVSATQDEAKACAKAARADRKANKAERMEKKAEAQKK